MYDAGTIYIYSIIIMIKNKFEKSNNRRGMFLVHFFTPPLPGGGERGMGGGRAAVGLSSLSH